MDTAVQGTRLCLNAAVDAGVKRVVLTSSLAAVECGNDEGELTEQTWSKVEVYDNPENPLSAEWRTHYTYVKSKVEQEKVAAALAAERGLDLRIVVPGNLCVGPIANGPFLNGTMSRLKDIVTGTNTLKGAADLAVVHVLDVVEAHYRCMVVDAAQGRYVVARDLVKIEEVFRTLKELYPHFPVADLGAYESVSGVSGKHRTVQAARTHSELGIGELRPLQVTLKAAVDAMVEGGIVAPPLGGAA